MVVVKEMYPTKHGMCVNIIYVVVAVTFMFCELPVIVLWQWNCKLLGYYIEFYSSVSDEKMLALSKNKTNKQKIKKNTWFLNFAYMFTALRFKCRYFSKFLNLKIHKVNFTEFFNAKAIHFFEVAHSKWWNL